MTRSWRLVPFIFLLATACATTSDQAREASRPLTSREAFLASCAQMGLAYAEPPGVTEVPVRENPNAAYDFAVAAPGKYEVRIALVAPGKGREPLPENVALALVAATLSNVSQGGQTLDSKRLGPTEAAAFGADRAFMAIIAGARSEFAAGFKHMVFLDLHREGVGDVFLYVLFNDPNALEEETVAAFDRILRFTAASPAPAPEGQ